ncbi:inner membrane protein [Desulfovibrio gilichinskyi]|uniref:Inner membrane protein n=2 Tax=Desulfovibrio gilichinskyi TaxID=1519643 RepID=A0A1X7CGJ3_9BACT|nr:metal-dependent hydrolase [Desulfovibrio gilichinskyi]SME96148.1 inner membrane protein [Desulfovibrio gilichinskyi]
MRNLYCASASWIPTWLHHEFAALLLMILGAILPDIVDRAFSGHKRATHLQYKKNAGEWLSEREFSEMLEAKKSWWAIHRKLTHWWVIPIILYAIGLQPVAIGWASHLLLDAITPMGIPKLSPFPKDETGYMRFTFLSDLKWFEGVVTLVLVAMTIAGFVV